MLLSIIICTHNPREDYLRRTLDALKSQTLPKDKWELLIIDNACEQPLAGKWDLSWHPRSRHIREEQLGLTHARIRGIRESNSTVLAFVDDDNLLAADYLEQSVRIGKKYTWLGAWGGGIVPEFEEEPPAWMHRLFPYLTLREVQQERWSNFTDLFGSVPWGAGLCIRREVGLHYTETISKGHLRTELDRKGSGLLSYGDVDLALTACDLGMGTGLFPELQLTHLIPVRRLEDIYLYQLVEGVEYSKALLSSLRGKPPEPPSWQARIMADVRALRRGWRLFKAHRSAQRGIAAALHMANMKNKE